MCCEKDVVIYHSFTSVQDQVWSAIKMETSPVTSNFHLNNGWSTIPKINDGRPYLILDCTLAQHLFSLTLMTIIKYYTEQMMVTLFLSRLQPNRHEIWHEDIIGKHDI